MILSSIITRRLFPSRSLVTSFMQINNNRFNFSNFKPPLPTDVDSGNLFGLLNTQQTPFLTFWEKIDAMRPTALYQSLDQYSRELLFTFANDLGWGLPLGIIAVSLLIRGLFFYPGIMAQMNGMKTKQLQPIMKRYQQKMQAAQMSRNKALMAQAKKQFNQARKQKGIDTFLPLLNILQIPLVLTWFLSLRYITTLPEVYTQLQTQPFLWIKDLSVYDPYFILPFMSAAIMSISLMYSPNLNKQNVQMAFLVPYVKYFKFLPFLSLPITAMFPAAINIYWCTISLVQLVTVGMLHTKAFQLKTGIIHKVQKPTVIQAAIIEQKRSQRQETGQQKQQQKDIKKPIVNSQAKVQTIQILTNKPRNKKKKDNQ